MVSGKMTGAEDIIAALREVAPQAVTGMNNAARKALQPVLKQARANAPVDDGDLKKALTIKRDGKAPRRQSRFVVGPSAAYTGKDGSKPVRYAHLTEFGRADGSRAGTRWMTRAWEQTQGGILDTLGKETWPEIEKAVESAAKRSVKRKASR